MAAGHAETTLGLVLVGGLNTWEGGKWQLARWAGLEGWG